MPARRQIVRSGLVSVLLVFATVTHVPASAQAGEATPSPPGSPPAAAPKTIDDIFEETSQEVPGFGGAYVVGDETLGQSEHLFLWLTDPDAAKAARARNALVRRGLGPRFDKPDYTVRVATYDFGELADWHRDLQTVFGDRDVVFTDIDEQRNRLTIGIKDLTSSERVRALAMSRGVPGTAVEFVQASGFTPELRSERRPMRGGLQIAFQADGGLGVFTNICSLGFPVVRAGVNGFVTNSHCSRTQGSVDDGR